MKKPKLGTYVTSDVTPVYPPKKQEEESKSKEKNQSKTVKRSGAKKK